MASKPIQRQLEMEIAVRYGGGSVDAGWDALVDRIAEGAKVVDMAREFGISVNFFSTRLHADADRSAAVSRAREAYAASLIDETVDIADNANEISPAGVSKAKLQVDTRHKVAAFLAPHIYGPKQQAAVVVNFGDSYLALLSEKGKARAISATATVVEAVPVPEPDVEDLL